MKVRVKKLIDEVELPKKAHDTDAGFDLVATSIKNNINYVEYGTSLAIEIPKNHVGLLFPRSSISKLNMNLANSVGCIDHGYTGEVKFRFKPATTGEGIYNVGDRVGQLIIMPYPEIELVEVKELSETDRNTGGFGGTN